MGSKNPSSLQEIAADTIPVASSSAANPGLSAIGQPYAQNWNTNIWGTAAIGSGLRPSSNEPNRQQNRLGSLSTAEIPAMRPPPPPGAERTEGITGSGSLLASSESEGYVRRGSAQWPALPAMTNGFANNQHGHGNASPVRPRTNQNTRSNSPFTTTNGQLSGLALANGQPSARNGVDPRSRNVFGNQLNPSFDMNMAFRQDEHNRRPQYQANFGALGANGGYPYSGYSSGAASRSGSLPPSRHGHEPNGSMGEQALAALHNTGLDGLNPSLGQQGRTHLASQGGQRARNAPQWNPAFGDEAFGMGSLDINQDPNPLFAQQQQQAVPPSPSRLNGTFNPQGYSRNNSVSFDQDYRMTPPNAYRAPYQDRLNHSPSDSDQRRNHDSPYMSQTPLSFDHQRMPSNASTRSNLGSFYGQVGVENNLQRLADQQQMLLLHQQQQQQQQQQFGYSQGIPQLNRSAYEPSLTPQMLARLNASGQFLNGSSPVGGYPSHPAQSQRMPTPRGPATEASVGSSTRSQLLEEFRVHRNAKRYELKDIHGLANEFSGDQHGSRFIQTKLEAANSDEKAQLFDEILPNAYQLTRDVFGNYVIQKLFEFGNQVQKKQLADKLRGQIFQLSLEMYACRVVQKAFEFVLTDQQATLVKELEPHVMKCIRDQNGNHVIQKAIARIPPEHIMFIIDAVIGQVQPLALHAYGCRVIQRLLESCPDTKRIKILEELHACAQLLITDQYGNYVTQHIIVHGRPEDRDKMIELTLRDIVTFAKHKFASNVVEKCIVHGSAEQLKSLVDRLSAHNDLYSLINHEYGNYVIQKLLKTLSGSAFTDFTAKLQPPLAQAKRQSYGRSVGQIEKLLDSEKTSKKVSSEGAESVTSNGTSVAAKARTGSPESQDESQPTTNGPNGVSAPEKPRQATNGNKSSALQAEALEEAAYLPTS